jgi:hypothetical protein
MPEVRRRLSLRSARRLPVLLKAAQRVLLHRQSRLTTNAVSDSTGQLEFP